MAIPSDIANLYAWYRADSFSLNDGDTCGTWTDKGASARNLPALGAPKFRKNVINGQPAVEYNGAPDTHQLNPFSWRTNLANHTLWVVFKPFSGVSINRSGVVSSDGGDISEAIAYRQSTEEVMARASQGGGTSVVILKACPANAWHYAYEWQASASQIAIALDGAAETTAAIGARDATYPTNAGAQLALDGGSYWQGQIAEAVIYSVQLSSADIASLISYFQARYFTVSPSQVEPVRDIASRSLRLKRRPIPTATLTVPGIASADVPLLEDIALTHFGITTADGLGGGYQRKSRYAYKLLSTEVAPDQMQTVHTFFDPHAYYVSVWDQMVGSEPSNAASASGVPRLSVGASRTFSRTTQAYVTDAANPAVVSLVSLNRDKLSNLGTLIEGPKTNYQIQSSFANGLTGWTSSGGVGTIVATSSDLLFSGLQTKSIRFTGPSATSSDFKIIGTATTTFAAASILRVSLDHRDDSGYPLSYYILRSADSLYWRNSDATWQAVLTWNQMDVSTSGTRYATKQMTVTTSASCAVTCSIGQTSTGQANQLNYLYHVQVENDRYANSRIVTQVASVASSGDILRWSNDQGVRTWPLEAGTAYIEFMPNWDSADLASSDKKVLLSVEHGQNAVGGIDYEQLLYSQTSSAFIFRRSLSNVNYDAVYQTATSHNTTYKIACRWTGSEGELGKANYTLSIFVNSSSGTDATPGDIVRANYLSAEFLRVGHSSSGANYADGALKNLLIQPFVLADEEIGDLP